MEWVGIRRGLVGICAVALASGSMIGTAEIAGSVPIKVDACWTLACTVAGKAKLKPGLVAAPQAGKVLSLNGKLTCSTGQTGNAAVTVTSGKIKATSVPFTGSCTAASPASLSGTIKWKATGGKANLTTIGSATGVSSSTSPYSFGFRSATVTGSYAGHSGTLFVASSTASSVCGTKGIKKLAITGRVTFIRPGAIGAGDHNTCARTSTGAARCWGWNGTGSLGNGTNTHSNVPVAVSGLASGVAGVDGGVSGPFGGHMCATTTAGAARCWGGNVEGELGNGTNTDSNVPVAVSGLGSGVVAISAGSFHSCAVLASGAARCWGENLSGQLGNGTNTDSNVPVAVSGLGSGVVAISAGSNHSCAVLASGAARCWGSNGNNELGNGTNTSSNVPVAVSGLGSGVVAISVGSFHTCASLATGATRCWGENVEGQLGNGTNTGSSVPVAVSGLGSGVVAISAGYRHNCATLASGAARCWGGNVNGQLGNATNTASNVPVAVSGLGSGVLAVSTGTAHSCAVLATAAARCWGFNGTGSLGNGANDDSNVPVTVTGLAAG